MGVSAGDPKCRWRREKEIWQYSSVLPGSRITASWDRRRLDRLCLQGEVGAGLLSRRQPPEKRARERKAKAAADGHGHTSAGGKGRQCREFCRRLSTEGGQRHLARYRRYQIRSVHQGGQCLGQDRRSRQDDRRGDGQGQAGHRQGHPAEGTADDRHLLARGFRASAGDDRQGLRRQAVGVWVTYIQRAMATLTPSAVPRPNLVGLGRTALAAEMAAFGAEPFRARQLWHWIYHRGATDFAAMTSLSKAFRERLAALYELCRPAVSRALTSIDGTRKWLLRFADGQEVETVHIPEEERGTLCVSSQVGCTLTCSFCHTGTQRLVRNLR